MRKALPWVLPPSPCWSRSARHACSGYDSWRPFKGREQNAGEVKNPPRKQIAGGGTTRSGLSSMRIYGAVAFFVAGEDHRRPPRGLHYFHLRWLAEAAQISSSFLSLFRNGTLLSKKMHKMGRRVVPSLRQNQLMENPALLEGGRLWYFLAARLSDCCGLECRAGCGVAVPDVKINN